MLPIKLHFALNNLQIALGAHPPWNMRAPGKWKREAAKCRSDEATVTLAPEESGSSLSRALAGVSGLRGVPLSRSRWLFHTVGTDARRRNGWRQSLLSRRIEFQIRTVPGPEWHRIAHYTNSLPYSWDRCLSDVPWAVRWKPVACLRAAD